VNNTWPYPLWWAHRGAGQLAPENTLAAFRLGAQLGNRAFECDVKLSTDDVPFLLHDDTLERTTCSAHMANHTAGGHTWSTLSQLDAGSWHSPVYAGEPLPSLRQIAQFCLRNHLALNIELKPSPGCEARTGRVVAELVASLWRHAAGPPPLLSSFSAAALQAAQIAAPDLPRALLLNTLPPNLLNLLTQTNSLSCVAVVLKHDLITAALIQTLHNTGLRVLAYTVNEAARAEQLIAWAIDGLITDAVDHTWA
jgi:glycerophosphoryl diester phosphodiesterase